MNMLNHRKTGLLSLATLWLALISPVGQAADINETIGDAYELNGEQLLYRETHCVDPSGQLRDVIYEDGQGELMASKRVDYSSGRTTPSFVQDNLYSSERVEVRLDDGKLTMAILDAGSSEPKKLISEQPSDKLPIVIDAGFDEFVRSHWDELVEGEDKRFQFPFAARSSLVELRIRRFGCSYDTDTDQCFRLELSNFLLRMLVAPIELGYDADTRRLTRYRGLSNIGDADGNGLVVDIQYRYRDLPARACEDRAYAPVSSQVRLERVNPSVGDNG